MFERRSTVSALYKQARARGKDRAIRIPRTPMPMLPALTLACLRLIVSLGIGASLRLQNAPALVAGLGLMIFSMRWEEVATATALSPSWVLLYPASGELIWRRQFRTLCLSSLSSAIDALAIIAFLGIYHKISVPLALASIPSAVAYGTWMTTLPLLLVLGFRSFRASHIITPVFFMGCGALFSAKGAPSLFPVFLRWWGSLAWFVPLGWFYHFERVEIEPVYRLLLGCAALALGALLIKPLASALERRVIQREEDAEAQDAIASNIREIHAEHGDEEEEITEEIITPLSEARALLDGAHWGTFSPPQTLTEIFFWRTLNDRQKLIARLIWPFGLLWSKAHRALFIAMAICLAMATALRSLSLTGYAWIPLAGGAAALFMFAPPLPGFQFVFELLFIGGRNAARCQLIPVSTSEISRILQRCQWIRAAGACWIGAAYGAAAWLILRRDITSGIANGVFVVFFSIGLHPFALLMKLFGLIHHRGRRWVALPCLFIGTFTIIVGIIGTLTGMVMIIAPGAAPPSPRYLIPIMFACLLIWWSIGQALLKIYLLMLERSWLDAIVEIPKQR